MNPAVAIWSNFCLSWCVFSEFLASIHAHKQLQRGRGRGESFHYHHLPPCLQSYQSPWQQGASSKHTLLRQQSGVNTHTQNIRERSELRVVALSKITHKNTSPGNLQMLRSCMQNFTKEVIHEIIPQRIRIQNMAYYLWKLIYVYSSLIKIKISDGKQTQQKDVIVHEKYTHLDNCCYYYFPTKIIFCIFCITSIISALHQLKHLLSHHIRGHHRPGIPTVRSFSNSPRKGEYRTWRHIRRHVQ